MVHLGINPSSTGNFDITPLRCRAEAGAFTGLFWENVETEY